MAEAKEIDQTVGRRLLSLLEEYESMDASSLIVRGAELSATASVEFYGGEKNRGMVDLIYRANLPLFLRTAPYLEDAYGLSVYLQLIRQLTGVTRKILSFGTGSRPVAVLGGVQSADIPKTSSEALRKFPPIAALGYALAAIEVYGNENINEQDCYPEIWP